MPGWDDTGLPAEQSPPAARSADLIPADLIVYAAAIHTMVPGAATPATALAIAGGRILAVGEKAELAALIGPETAVVDLAEATVLPGLIDAHNHHALAGRAELFECQFPDTAQLPHILSAVQRWVAEHPDDEWVIGGSWGSGLFDVLAGPGTLATLDAVSGGKKVLLSDDSHHNKWANTAALVAAGFTAEAADPPGGQLLRTPDGALTGVLIEAAGAQAEAAWIEATQSNDVGLDAQRWAACSARGIEIMNSHGITAFMDAGASEGTMAGLARLDTAGGLTAWAVSAMLVNDAIFGNRVLGTELFDQAASFRTRHHRPEFAKIFLDGVPPSYTAAFLEPYAPSERHGDHFHGSTTMPPEALLEWLRIIDGRGLGVKIHCTGDASVRFVLDAVATLRSEGSEAMVHIAHGQYVSEADVPRFGELGVIAEISPALWFPGTIVEALRRVLPIERANQIQPNRDLLDAGAVIACGSDWPVAPNPSPWRAISGLVTRADPSGTFAGTLWPEQAVTVAEALTAYTLSGAIALGLAEETGSLAPGKSADFVVLDQDPFTVDPSALAGIGTLQTWFDGRCVYQAKGIATDRQDP